MNDEIKVSVAMATFNGENYIIDQLDSLRCQTRKIDECIIIDDCSFDNTFSIIEEYIKKWDLSCWSVSKNTKNEGWKNTFIKLSKMVTGDFLFFCDQDDIWDLKKIEIMSDVLINNEHINVLACKVELIDSAGKRINDSKETIPFYYKKTKKISNVKFDNKFLYSIFPGCTMGIKKSNLSYVRNFDVENFPHDALFWKTGILEGSSATIDLPLVKYRIHSNNASSPSTKTNYRIQSIEDRIETAISFHKSFLIILRISKNMNLSKDKIKRLENINQFCLEREQFLNRKKGTLMFFMRNIKYYRNLKMFIGDLLSRRL